MIGSTQDGVILYNGRIGCAAPRKSAATGDVDSTKAV
jgi:hypothetical protein